MRLGGWHRRWRAAPVGAGFSDVRFYTRVAIRPHLAQAGLIALLMLASAALEAASVGLAVPLLDALTHADGGTQNSLVMLVRQQLERWRIAPSTNSVIFALMAVACCLFMLRSGLLLLYQYSTASVAQALRREMKQALLGRFLHAPYEEVIRQARGTIVHHINVPSEALYVAMISLGQLVSSTFDCALMVGLMLYLSWPATLVIGSLAVLGVQGWRRFADRRAAAYGRVIYDVRGDQAKIEVDAIDGLRTVKAYTLEQAMVERQQALLEAETRPTLRVALVKYAPHVVNEGLAGIVVLGLGALMFFVPSFGMRLSLFAALLLAIRRITPAMGRVTAASAELSRCRRSLEVLDQVVSRMPQERRGGKAAPDPVEEVELADVAFRYASRPDHEVLGGISLRLHRGEVTAIVGPTGSGKSTIANLLVGLYEPLRGCVRINGVELGQFDLADWRRTLGCVAQDLFVFNATVRDNISLWSGVDEAQVVQAARVAQLHEFIAGLPAGYDTMVGDRGLRLSGGQCQRLAIARAVLRQPQVLILDEATSAMDTQTERAVYGAITALRSRAIILVIAHRLSTIREADHIVVVRDGEIVERGAHATLMQQDGLYAALYAADDRSQEQEPAELKHVG